MTKTLIFDFDGVIINSFDFHLQLLNEFFETDITADEYRAAHMGNFHDGGVPKLAGLDYDAYAEELKYRFPQANLVSPSCKEFLQYNQQDKYIVTSAHETSTNTLLQSEGLADQFKAVLGMEINPSKLAKFYLLEESYGVDLASSLFITDTVGDIQEAHKANLPTVAVDFGFHSRWQLEQAKPEYICSSWDEVQDLLKT